MNIPGTDGFYSQIINRKLKHKECKKDKVS